MEKRRLGKTDLNVSRLGFGGLFVTSRAAARDEAVRSVRRAVELGVNYFDTAPAYGNSEEVLGEALRGIKAPLVVSTKLGGRPQPFDPRSRDQLLQSIDQSLKLLGRDVIDLLLIHEPDRPGQYDWFDSWDRMTGPVRDAMEDARRRGLIRYTGVGGTTAYELAWIVDRGGFDVVLTAFNYSLLWREAENAILPTAKKRGVGVIAGSPLQQGWLARRFEAIRKSPPPWLSPARRKQILWLYEYLDELEMPITDVALRFVLSNAQIDCVLMGSRSVRETEANIAAAEAGPLPAEILEELKNIADLVPFRPYEEPFGCKLADPSYRGPGPA